MKTWEMIKELTENPNKKFTYDSATKGSYVTVVDDVVVWKGAGQGGQTVAICLGCGDAEWEEVKEPVSFMEALKAAKECKLVGLVHKMNNISYKNRGFKYILEDLSSTKEFTSSFIAETLLNGEWYIED